MARRSFERGVRGLAGSEGRSPLTDSESGTTAALSIRTTRDGRGASRRRWQEVEKSRGAALMNSVGAAITSKPARRNWRSERGMCIASVTSRTRLRPAESRIFADSVAFSAVLVDLSSSHLTGVTKSSRSARARPAPEWARLRPATRCRPIPAPAGRSRVAVSPHSASASAPPGQECRRRRTPVHA
jgi:hypothetical protein